MAPSKSPSKRTCVRKHTHARRYIPPTEPLAISAHREVHNRPKLFKMAAEFRDCVLVFGDLPEDDCVGRLGVEATPTTTATAAAATTPREVRAWSHVMQHVIMRWYVGGGEGVMGVWWMLRRWRREVRWHQTYRHRMSPEQITQLLDVLFISPAMWGGGNMGLRGSGGGGGTMRVGITPD